MRLWKALIAGFLILLPGLIAYLMLGQLFDLMMSLTAPITDLVPGEIEWDERLIAGILLIGVFVLVGLLAETGPARRLGSWLEHRVLDRFPPYPVLKSLSQRIGGRGEEGLQPALLSVGPDAHMLVAIVEELSDGRLTVFVPFAPTPTFGSLQIVSAEKVDPLECSMTTALGWMMNWGAGTEALLGGRDIPAGEKPVAG